MPTIDMPLEALRAYRGSSPRPEDFDRYWSDALQELNRLERRGFAPEWRDATFQVPFARCQDLYFNGVRGARLHARCVFPLHVNAPEDPRATGAQHASGTHQSSGTQHATGPARGGGKRTSTLAVPAVFRFHGYTMNAGDWSSLLPYAAAGMAVFALDVRGQGGESTDPGGVAGNTQRGHIVRGLDDEPEDLFFRQAFLDTAAVVRVAAALPEVDVERMGAVGASQGGALTLACAALEPRIRAAWAVYPFLSDYRRVWDLEDGSSAYEEIRHWLKRRDPRHERIDEVFRRLGYIDVQYLAPRIGADVVMVTGLMDQVCPPSSQFAAYNRLSTARSKRMILYPDFGHENLPDQADMVLSWMIERLDAGRGAPSVSGAVPSAGPGVSSSPRRTASSGGAAGRSGHGTG